MPAQTNLWIWPFELEEKIGEGGMGVVYRGRYVKNDRRVAVKLLPEDVADTTILARFEREVEILKNLRHPSIVRCFGGVCEDKRRFYAMELVEGGSLESLLKSRGGSIPWERAVEFGLQICSALQYAHEQNIIHRDLKPANFLLTKEGKLKLSDFGLATITSAHKLTQAGKTVGSFRFMAPEQVRGRPDPVPQTDLYAFGCVMFQMLVGRAPFEGNTGAELLNKHLSEIPPRVTAFVPEVPAAIDLLVNSLLQKDIQDRPATALDVSTALQSATSGAPVMTQTAFSIRRDSSSMASISSASDSRTQQKKLVGVPRLLLLAMFVIAVGLGIWSFSLSRKNRQLKPAVDLWLEASRSEDITIRRHARMALGKLATENDRAFKELASGLNSDDDIDRLECALALGESGVAGREVLPRLIKMQKTDKVAEVRTAALNSVGKIRNAGTRGLAWSWIVTIVLFVIVACGGGFYFYRRKIAKVDGQ